MFTLLFARSTYYVTILKSSFCAQFYAHNRGKNIHTHNQFHFDCFTRHVCWILYSIHHLCIVFCCMLVTKPRNLHYRYCPLQYRYSTSTVRWPCWYCPTFFCRSIVFHFSVSLCYVRLMFPVSLTWCFSCFAYGKFANYNTGNAIATLITITGTVIRKITIPVMLSWHIKTLPVW